MKCEKSSLQNPSLLSKRQLPSPFTTVDNCTMDYAAEQEMEIEALEAIFGDGLESAFAG